MHQLFSAEKYSLLVGLKNGCQVVEVAGTREGVADDSVVSRGKTQKIQL